jgi:DNA-binding NarL/FixJ family response regulator
MRAVIADDAVLVREGIARLLVDAEVEIVGQAGDAENLMRVVDAQRPDVAIVDIRMPPTHTDEGLVAAGEIRTRYPETAVIVLSQHLEPRYAIRLVNDNPARVGYLLKERVARVEELIDALRRVIAGECVVDRAVVQELLQRRRRDDPLGTLSPREREILELMAEGRSNQGICEAIWVSTKTVETHIHGVFVKLGLGNVPTDNRRVLAVLAYLRAV